MRSEVQRLPELFLERLRKMTPPQKWDAVANTFVEKKPTTFRVNTLKVGAGLVPALNKGQPQGLPLQEKLQSLGFRLERVPWYPDAFVLRSGRLRDLQETNAYKKGEIYVQSLSSMIPPLVLDPKPGEKILDLTAAPGSKTTQMACLMNGEGTILANDNNKIRFFKLRANIEQQVGARLPRPAGRTPGGETPPPQIELTLKPGELFGRDFPESFDRVLLDAPCSAEGRFLVTEPGSYKYWKPAKVKEMARKQKNLLLSGLRALKPSGVLVYSTCTFAPEENEAVLDWAIKKLGDQIEIENVGAGSPRPTGEATSPLQRIPNQMPGLSQWENQWFDPSLRNAVRILPTPLMEGFFVARLRKKVSL